MKLPIMFAAALAAAPTFAAESASDIFQAQAGALEALCQAEARLGRAIMEARQRGIPKPNMLDGIESPEHRTMVQAAYDMLRVPAGDQERVISEFGEAAEIDCYRRRVTQ